ncbi:DUF1127 domain-containing protein [Rhizobium sp. LjRoot30]|uniref:DUF1127 domain-containing protein n=1 Tax=Rhizobium sp. LjRoot30 TaxID=3342320 RepID=UPI003ECE02E8
MASTDHYVGAIDTIYPDGYARERLFRDTGEMLNPGPVHGDASLLSRLWSFVCLWQQERAGRLALRELTDDQLRDIGVSRKEAGIEVAKSYFWD